MKRLFVMSILVVVLSACGTLTEDGLVIKTANPKLSIGFRLHQPPPLPTVEPQVLPDPTASPVPAVDPCTLVKGNIARNGARRYHLPGMPNFNQVVPEMCFVTEQDALDAGFIKAGN